MSPATHLKRALAVFGLLGILAGCAGVAEKGPVLSHELYGHGPVHVVVLHDWLGDRGNYEATKPYLDTKNFTFAFADLRGYGGSKAIPGTFDENEAAADTLRLADSLGWQQFHIIGHSMSGMIVQRVAADAPDRVLSVIATSPVAANGMQTDPKTRKFLEGAAVDPDVMAQAVQALTGNRLGPLWATYKVARAMGRSTQAARLTYLDMFDKHDFHKDVMGLTVPMTMILGKNDLPFFQPPYIKDTFGKWYPNLTIVQSPNAGHYSMQETPVFYATTVNRALRKAAGLKP